MRYFKDKHFMIISMNLLGIFFFYGYQGKINIIEKKTMERGGIIYEVLCSCRYPWLF